MQKINYIFLFLVILSCDKLAPKVQDTKNLEIYKTTGDEKTMQVGPMTHHESTMYEGNKKVATSYFETDGTLKGKELFYYDESQDTVPIRAEYIDAQQKQLSYYKYIKNGNGQLIASYAFDASSHELLRVEEYYYIKNLMTSKRIFDGQLNPNRRYAFTYDTDGNESGFQVYGATDSLIVKEEFRITKKDEKNRWTEKWGFANGKPVTFHKRN